MSSSLIWPPGMAGPLEELVSRIHRRVELFAEQRGWDKAFVEIEFVDGVRYGVHSISPEPGFGFITICPYPEDDERAEPVDERLALDERDPLPVADDVGAEPAARVRDAAVGGQLDEVGR